MHKPQHFKNRAIVESPCETITFIKLQPQSKLFSRTSLHMMKRKREMELDVWFFVVQITVVFHSSTFMEDFNFSKNTRRKLGHYGRTCDQAMATRTPKMHKKINVAGKRGGLIHGHSTGGPPGAIQIALFKHFPTHEPRCLSLKWLSFLLVGVDHN